MARPRKQPVPAVNAVSPRRSDLTPQEKITVAYAHFVLGHTQQDIALHYPGVHSGRVNEACKAIGGAIGLTLPGYKDR